MLETDRGFPEKPSIRGRTNSHDAPMVRLAGCSVEVPAFGNPKTLKQKLLGAATPRVTHHLLLHEINLEAEAGECIGVVGRNGTGKSTLLRLIAGIYPPSHGIRDVAGSIAPVLSLGGGLDPELSLRINIRLGLIHGNRHHLYSEELAEQILEFAELSPVANEPMRHLSAGFQARFAFSLSLHQSTQILILDEVFAVGDAGFFKKARVEMQRRMSASPIIFIASHDESEIRSVCTRALLMHDGQIKLDAEPAAVLAEYNSHFANE